MIITLYDPGSGELGFQMSGSAEELEPYLELTWIEGAYDAQHYKVDTTTGEIVEKTKPLEVQKAELWERVKQLRDHKQYNGCETAFGRVQTDESSRSNINGAVTGAVLDPVNFTVDWTLEDNSVVTLDAMEMKMLGAQVLGFISACYDRARVLRELIDEAEDLDAIDITSGWPV